MATCQHLLTFATVASLAPSRSDFRIDAASQHFLQLRVMQSLTNHARNPLVERSHSAVARVLAWLIVAMLFSSGCSLIRSDWEDQPTPSNSSLSLTPAKSDRDTVTLDVEFISLQLDATEPDPSEPLWHWVDEMIVKPEPRATLRQNGLRIGRVHTLSEFNRTLAQLRRTPQSKHDELLASAAVGSDVLMESKRYPFHVGRRQELPVRPTLTGVVPVLVSAHGQTIGKSLDSPQPLFALTPENVDGASVRLKLLPEIQYGAMRPTWVGSDSALRLESRRERWVLDDLALEVDLAEQGTLVVGAVFPERGLGN